MCSRLCFIIILVGVDCQNLLNYKIPEEILNFKIPEVPKFEGYGNAFKTIEDERRRACSLWHCDDDTCLGKPELICNGIVDCRDGSDETFMRCRNEWCPHSKFRCNYGGCVDRSALCNNQQDCADNSDEIQSKCFNETTELHGRPRVNFKCRNGDSILVWKICDGAVDCTDGSDETFRLCASHTCAGPLIRCAYGACASGKECDGKVDCADGSDESNELCNRIGQDVGAAGISKLSTNVCVLPAYPLNGSYKVNNAPNASPGRAFGFYARIELACNQDYKLTGASSFTCHDGLWNGDMPECLLFCPLDQHVGTEYRCLNKNESERECRDAEPSGTIVQPKCRTPNYYHKGGLNPMKCIEGSWDHVATCSPVPSYILKFLHHGREKSCGDLEWQCKDGTCVSYLSPCDGLVNCPDGSDETFALCRRIPCLRNQFQCTYGACVDDTAPCNGQQECADNSDELQPKCFNGTDEVQSKFKCKNGQLIPVLNHCDGVADCTDGSDETLRACAGRKCFGYLFQCAYGACIAHRSECNGKNDCADGSDEWSDVCANANAARLSRNDCVLPAYPLHGSYVAAGAPNAGPGQAFEFVQINITCNPTYTMVGNSSLMCYQGTWSDGIPECVRFCQLNKHPSVEYRCLITGKGSQGTRKCGESEPSGTIVQPECRTLNYYSIDVLPFMRCVNGRWDYIATCSPECGRVTPSGEALVMGGWSSRRGEVPWHAGVYRKTITPYRQICGGTLVTNTAVISAAHCFWSQEAKQFPASQFVVALGKLHQEWDHPLDVDVQVSEVRDIKIPVRFQGNTANFQDDIALVLLTNTVIYKTHIRPACIDFDVYFETRQLQDGNLGKVAGWGMNTDNSNTTHILQVITIPYVTVEQCIAQSPSVFKEYITSDKICAGYSNGTALCKGDSGGGLTFADRDRGADRYYLRGVVSTAPTDDTLHNCKANALTSFTQIIKHEHFIKEWISL